LLVTKKDYAFKFTTLMNANQIAYLVFGILLLLALVFDLGLLSKRGKIITIKAALTQTFFWVFLAFAFFIFMWMQEGQKPALEYISAYLMEWSLSIDNIFVFILIFNSFGVKEKNYSRVLLIGILMAIFLRILFITVGVAAVEKFEWLLLVFGAFLIYTGYKMFTATDDQEFDPQQSKIYKFLRKFLPLVPHDGNGRYIIWEKRKPFYTTLFVVVILLASTDLVFALDSIPAVMGISREKFVIYSSNIFAVLGLRSLFFLLRGAVSKFDYLQQGIAIVLVFIGLKMLGEHWLNEWISKEVQVFISLGVILICISGSIFYSISRQKKGEPKDVVDETVK
jgi:tellurite resistance protein TerC